MRRYGQCPDPVPASSPEKLTVETIDNHIYFYSEVTEDRTLAVIKELRATESRLRLEKMSRGGLPTASTPIWLHIHSPGGLLHTGMALADIISTIQTPVYSMVEGYCCSAATLFSIVCDKRYITPLSYMMIHEFSSAMWGKYRDFKDEMVVQDMLIEQLAGHYAKHTSLTKSKARKLLDHDSWFSAEQCVELGLADEVWVGE